MGEQQSFNVGQAINVNGPITHKGRMFLPLCLVIYCCQVGSERVTEEILRLVKLLVVFRVVLYHIICSVLAGQFREEKSQ